MVAVNNTFNARLKAGTGPLGLRGFCASRFALFIAQNPVRPMLRLPWRYKFF
jgi:hypothetical protein